MEASINEVRLPCLDKHAPRYFCQVPMYHHRRDKIRILSSEALTF